MEEITPRSQLENQNKASLKWAYIVMSPLLRFEEIDEQEWTMFREQFQYPSSPLLSLVQNRVPNSTKNRLQLFGHLEDQTEIEKEEKNHLNIMSQNIRCLVYAYRRTGTLVITDQFLLEVNKAGIVQIDPVYIKLLRTCYSSFDVNLKMRIILMAIGNPVVLDSIKECIDTQMEKTQMLEILIRVLSDSYLVRRIENNDETETFKEILIPHLQMSQDIPHNHLYQMLVPVFDQKIQKWEKYNENHFSITFYEEIIHRIRQDTLISIDVILPKKLTLVYDGDSQTLVFKGEVPLGRLALGGVYLGKLQKIRALTVEEEKETDGEKQFESTIIAGYGVSWALKLLGAPRSTFLVALGTIWWYFRTLKEQ